MYYNTNTASRRLGFLYSLLKAATLTLTLFVVGGLTQQATAQVVILIDENLTMAPPENVSAANLIASSVENGPILTQVAQGTVFSPSLSPSQVSVDGTAYLESSSFVSSLTLINAYGNTVFSSNNVGAMVVLEGVGVGEYDLVVTNETGTHYLTLEITS